MWSALISNQWFGHNVVYLQQVLLLNYLQSFHSAANAVQCVLLYVLWKVESKTPHSRTSDELCHAVLPDYPCFILTSFTCSVKFTCRWHNAFFFLAYHLILLQGIEYVSRALMVGHATCAPLPITIIHFSAKWNQLLYQSSYSHGCADEDSSPLGYEATQKVLFLPVFLQKTGSFSTSLILT